MREFDMNKWGFGIVCGIILFCFGIYGVFKIGANSTYDEAVLEPGGFIGTYGTGDSEEFITVLGGDDSRGYRFYVYSDSEENDEIEEGDYQIIDNTIFLKNKDGKIVYSVVYSHGEFWVINMKTNKSHKTNKFSDNSYTPYGGIYFKEDWE